MELIWIVCLVCWVATSEAGLLCITFSNLHSWILSIFILKEIWIAPCSRFIWSHNIGPFLLKLCPSSVIIWGTLNNAMSLVQLVEWLRVTFGKDSHHWRRLGCSCIKFNREAEVAGWNCFFLLQSCDLNELPNTNIQFMPHIFFDAHSWLFYRDCRFFLSPRSWDFLNLCFDLRMF